MTNTTSITRLVTVLIQRADDTKNQGIITQGEHILFIENVTGIYMSYMNGKDGAETARQAMHKQAMRFGIL
jgi:hypothetical protein